VTNCNFLVSLSILFISLLLNITAHATDNIKVYGNSKTQTSYIIELTQKCINKENRKVSNKMLSQCLLNTKLFSKVSVKRVKNQIVVTVEDRWTLIPIPNIKSGSAGNSIGLFVLDSNFLGRGKTTVLGGSIGAGQNTYFLLLKDPSLNYSNWTLNMRLFAQNKEFESRNKKSVTYSFERKYKAYAFSLGYRFNDLEIAFELGYHNKAFYELNSYKIPPGNKYYTSGAQLFLNNSNYKFYFNEGLEVRLKYLQQINRSDQYKKANFIHSLLSYQSNIWKKHALQFRYLGSFSSKASLSDLYTIGGPKPFRGVDPAAIWATNIQAASLDYQIPIYTSGSGTWTTAPFMDYGKFNAYFNDVDDYFSYGLGVYLYLKKVAIPGIGVVAGRNNNFIDNFFSISIGMER
jgi:outer membrane protein assembly factor BamA